MSSVRTLRTFVAVATEGSFAAAAHRVALTQAAVGQQMRTLEAEMRRALFERQGKAIVLNDAGRELLPLVRQQIALHEQMLALAHTHEPMAGAARLGAVVSAVRPLVRATLELKARHPDLDLHVMAAKSGELISRVESGELDAALVVRDPAARATSLAWTALYAEPLIVLAPQGTEKSLGVRQLLAQQPFLRFDRSELTGQLVERTLRKMRVKPREFLELNSIETIVELTRSGFGITLLPHLRESRWLRDPRLQVLQLAGTPEMRHIALAQRKDDEKASLIAAVARALHNLSETGPSAWLPGDEP
ncbi:MAG: LysR family transcriptional regulator [Rubrivivax sp.]|nr:MAG: LysR family transcriptional regulator [Rubrivivax sp.]